MSKRIYADRYCADGVISDGWRRVKQGGKVKIGGYYYANEKLAELTGELVHVQVGEYHQTYVLISRGRIGCMDYFCRANVCE